MNYLKKSFSVGLGSKAYRDNFDAVFGQREPDEDSPPAPDEVVDPDLGVEAVPAPDADLPAHITDAEKERKPEE
jgi:hypothetical protein